MNEEIKCENTFRAKEYKFTGIQDLLADDFAEGVQAVVLGLFSGNLWGWCTVGVQET